MWMTPRARVATLRGKKMGVCLSLHFLHELGIVRHVIPCVGVHPVVKLWRFCAVV